MQKEIKEGAKRRENCKTAPHEKEKEKKKTKKNKGKNGYKTLV